MVTNLSEFVESIQERMIILSQESGHIYLNLTESISVHYLALNYNIFI